MNAPVTTPSAMPATSQPLRVTRVFEAPRALVFAAFTQLEHLDRWFSPKGFGQFTGSLDLRVGGHYHYAMSMPDGQLLWGKWTFREIVAPERIVVVSQFSDEHGGLTRNPWTNDWPMTTLSTTTFVEQGPKRTLLTLEWRALDATETEQAAFDAGHASMTEGWGGTFDKLAEHLATAARKG